MLIDGKLVDAESGKTFSNINPATEESLGEVADGAATDMEKAIAAARRAFDTTDWATNPEMRKACILQLQKAIEGEVEDFRAELISEVGCPLLTTYGPQLDVPLKEALTWPAAMIDKFPWSRTLEPKDAMGLGHLSEPEVWKEPVGVVGVIVPWNFPVEITLNKLGPVLAMGNTCVVKPAPDTPFNATRLARLIAEQTDIPPGVVNVVNSSDHLVGEILSTSADVDMVAFTGSTATGRRVMQAASATLKPVFLELGGKSVNLVPRRRRPRNPTAVASCSCASTPARAAPSPPACSCPIALRRGGRSHGRRRSRAGATATRPTPRTSRARRCLAASRSGCSATSRRARKKAPGVVTGGGMPAHLPKGFYVEPTLFADVDNSMTIAREEIFGPVIVVIPHDGRRRRRSDRERSEYGLSGMITSGDLERAKAVARRIRTGTLCVNSGLWYGADEPFGGYKAAASAANAASKA